MPKGIVDQFQIPYIEISNIEKWSKKEYKTPKEFNKYYPSTENAEGAEEAEASSKPEGLEIQSRTMGSSNGTQNSTNSVRTQDCDR